MKHAIFLPPTGELADPSVYASLAGTAEASGWDGLFLWDHVLRAPAEPGAVADPWICLAVAATASSRLRLGTMITPVTRRRPIKLAREAVGLDQLSNGRLTLGLGLGVDSYGELSKLGEVVDARTRGQRLDEGVELLCRFWSGEEVRYHGEHFVADGVTVLPTPVQRPRVPLWFAARGDSRKPVRRAARYDGLFPVDVSPEQLRRMVDLVIEERGDLDSFDIASRPEGVDEYEAFAEAGATWALTGQRPGVDMAEAMSVASAPPARFFGLT
jgi:alkanesulfonate monooxygenase SsuD/methylene tetrahydromethanopterin reductase-like flavin-dependent oxidoreductase (luciferase family)